jgi:hypothetical protein
MDDQQTRISTMVILLGGHVRVGYEDNPYYRPNVLAKDAAQLVSRIKRIGLELNREPTDPTEARRMIGIQHECVVSKRRLTSKTEKFATHILQSSDNIGSDECWWS